MAILAVSTAGTLVRLAPGSSPLGLAAWRLGIASVVLLPWLRPLGRRELWWTLGGSLLLALHFWSWFTSLGLTSVMRSTLLVCLTPIWAGVLEGFLLKKAPAPRFWVGIAVALCGVVAMVGMPGEGGVLGDALALLGGLLGAAYFTAGRVVRATVPIGSYAALSCLATTGWLVLLALGSGESLALGVDARWAALGLALGPQLLGHVGFNYAVGRLPAAIVAAVILLEPVGATAVAALVLREWPTAGEVAGGTVTMIGVGIAAWPGRVRFRSAPVPSA